MKQSFVFPGQGSQTVGMGRDLYDNFASAKNVFDEVDEALSFNLSKVIFEGDMAELTQTQNTQPALMAMSMAVLSTLTKEFDYKTDSVAFVAGHSLGEYSALCAAGVMTLSDTARLLRARGQAMAEAALNNEGTMAVVLGLDFDTVAQIAKDAGVAVANDNSIGQIVLSGSLAGVEKAKELAASAGAKRVLSIPVSGAFHSPLMQSAADKMKEQIQSSLMNTPNIPVVMNVVAEPMTDVAQIKDLLVRQITGTVLWTDTVKFFARQGVEQVVELGAGKVLAGLVKKTEPQMATVSLGDKTSIEDFVKNN